MKVLACPGPGALRLDRAAVQLDQALHQREPEPEPALRAVERLARLEEQIEHVRQQLRRDADAVVRDLEHERPVLGPRRHAGDSPPGSVYLAALVSRFATTCASRVGIGVDRIRRPGTSTVSR